MIIPALENEFRKAESIIKASENLLARGINIDLSGLNRITTNLKQIIDKKYSDEEKYAGFIRRMDDINLSANNLSRLIDNRGKNK